MNLKNIGFAAAIANQAWKYLRDQNDKRERDIYQSLLDNLKAVSYTHLTLPTNREV